MARLAKSAAQAHKRDAAIRYERKSFWLNVVGIATMSISVVAVSGIVLSGVAKGWTLFEETQSDLLVPAKFFDFIGVGNKRNIRVGQKNETYTDEVVPNNFSYKTAMESRS